MGVIGELTVKIGADLADLKQKIGEAQSRVDGMSGKMQAVGAGMMKVGGALSLAVTAPILLMGKMGMEELNEIQAAHAQTEAAIKNVGAGSLVSAGHIEKQAAALQQLSGFDDQAVQGAENLLLRFGNLNVKTKEGAAAFDRAGKLAVDMGVSMGGPESAAKALAKGLADPMNNMAKLGKAAGLTKPQMASLKHEMEAAHSPAQKQAILMSALEQKYNGAGAAAGGTMAAKVAVMKDQLAGAAAGIVSQMLPAMTNLVEFVSKLTAKFSDMSPHAQRITAVLVVIAAAAGPVLIVMGSIATAVGALIPVFAAVGPIATAMWVAITGPIGLVILAILAVVAIGVVLYKHWDEIQAFAASIWGSIKDTISGIVDGIVAWLKGAWDSITATIHGVWEGIRSFLAAHMVLVALVVTGPIGALVVLLAKHWDDIKASAVAVWTAIKAAAGAAWGGIKSVISGAVDGVTAAVSSAVSGWASLMGGVWNTIKGAATTGWNAIKHAILDVVDGLPDGIANKLGDLGGKLVSVGKTAGAAFADAIKDAINAVINSIRNFELPKVEVAGKSIGGGKPFSSLPTFARGGVAVGPSIFGEAGPEAAVPLGSSAQARADRSRVMRQAGLSGGGGSSVVQNFYGPNVDWFVASRKAGFAFATAGVLR